MRPFTAVMVGAALAAMLSGARAEDAGAATSVLVATVPARMGSVPRVVVAFGIVQSAPGGSQTISVLLATQVRQVLVAVGQTVRQGQPLLVLGADPATLAAYKQAVSAVTLARSERARLAQMLAQHLATSDQVAQATKALSDAQANLETLRSAGADSSGQTLRAGFDGVVSAVPVAAGARVPADTPLLVVERSSSVVVAVGIEPSQRAVVAAGQEARIEPLEGGGPTIDGAVLSVGGMLDPVTRLVPVLIRPADGSNLLPGGPVRATLRVGDIAGWLVPRAAVLTDAKGPYLFQVSAGKAARTDVGIAGTSGDTTVVTGPVDPQRPIVSVGNYQLGVGMSVRTDDGAPAGVASR